MPRDGSGTFNRTNGVNNGPTIWQQDRDTIGTIDATRHDTEGNDYADALTGSLTADGQKVSSANQPMGGFNHTNVGNAIARTQYPSLGQLQDGEAVWVIATGTGDAMLAGYTPAIMAVVDGQQFRLRTPGANTIAVPTLSVGGTTARAIVKAGGDPLIAGDYTSGMEIIVRYKNLGTPVYELLTPVQADTSTFVPSSRLVDTAGMATGGGDLSADRTITVPIADQATAEAGTNNTDGMTALGTAQAIAAQTQIAFTEKEETAEQTISAAGLNTINYATLTGAPFIVQVWVRCKVAQFNYLVGDETLTHMQETGNGVTARGVAVVPGATSVTVRYGANANPLTILDKATGSFATITNANWALFLRMVR